MNTLPIKLPDGARQIGELYDTTDSRVLDQDVLCIALPNGIQVDVGWYPDHDPDGEYSIHVYGENWDQQFLPEPIQTKDRFVVAKEVSRLAFQFLEKGCTQ